MPVWPLMSVWDKLGGGGFGMELAFRHVALLSCCCVSCTPEPGRDACEFCLPESTHYTRKQIVESLCLF